MIPEPASVAIKIGPVLHSFAKNSLIGYKFILKVEKQKGEKDYAFAFESFAFTSSQFITFHHAFT